MTHYASVRIDTPLLEEIKRLYQNGISMIAGTSAGCVGLTGNLMLTGYETTSYEALRFIDYFIMIFYDFYRYKNLDLIYRFGSSSESANETAFTYNENGGMGFVNGYILDVHLG